MKLDRYDPWDEEIQICGIGDDVMGGGLTRGKYLKIFFSQKLTVFDETSQK